MDILLNEKGHIALNGGSFSMIQDRATLVAQRLSVRLRTYLGEWFLDTKMGIDWYADVLIKNVTRQTVDTIIQGSVRKDKYIVSIKNFSSKIVNRNYTCTFSVEIVGLDYIVELRYLANENNLIVTDGDGNMIVIDV